MSIIRLDQLSCHGAEVFRRVSEEQEPFLITHDGQAIAAIVPLGAPDLERYALAAAPEFLESRRQAERAGATECAFSIEDVARELGLIDPES